MDLPQITLLDAVTRLQAHMANFQLKRFWVTAEINQVHFSQKGYQSFELIEKKPNSLDVAAQMNASLYFRRASEILYKFREATGRELDRGLKVMLLVEVEFSRRYGTRLVIYDVDPAYTLGDEAQRRAATIQRLMRDGLLGLNKQKRLPVPTRRIAVVASQTSAGWGDFEKTIRENIYGFGYYACLFPATMQGPTAPDAIIAALREVLKWSFDAVAIVRGGGATTDLLAFDSEPLARVVANYPLPVITGIGHQRDHSVVDAVAFMETETPTAAATFFIKQTQWIKGRTDARADEFEKAVTAIVNKYRRDYSAVEKRFDTSVNTMLRGLEVDLMRAGKELNSSVMLRMTGHRHELERADKDLVNAASDYLYLRHQKLRNNSDLLCRVALKSINVFKFELERHQQSLDSSMKPYVLAFRADLIKEKNCLISAASDKACNLRSNYRSTNLTLVNGIKSLVDMQRMKLDRADTDLSDVTARFIKDQKGGISSAVERLSTAERTVITILRSNLTNAENTIQLLDPQTILDRGYSITTVNGHTVKRAQDLRAGMTVVTHLAEGTIESTVNE